MSLNMTKSGTIAQLHRYFPHFAAFLEKNPQQAWLYAAYGMAVIYIGMFVYTIATADGIVAPSDAIVGGDFLVFWSAAKAALTGNAVSIYDVSALQAAMAEAAPTRGEINLSWQYPPTVYFFLFPLGALPYLPALFAWYAVNLFLFVFLLHRLWPNRTAIILAMTSAAVFQGLITGQTGFMTATLLVVAAGAAKSRPILAGIAAGVLTIKPQFGILIPLAFAAAGCWRAFAAAAITGLLLAALSVAVFGVESWMAFFDAVRAHSDRLQSVIFPYAKLISPYGGMKTLAAPTAVAFAVHGLFLLGLAGFIVLVWRKHPDRDVRIMSLCAAAPLASPYAFYYELPMLVVAVFLLAKIGVEKGWLKWERVAAPVMWAAPLFVTSFLMIPGPPFASLLALFAFFLCARRIFAELDIRLSLPGA